MPIFSHHIWERIHRTLIRKCKIGDSEREEFLSIRTWKDFFLIFLCSVHLQIATERKRQVSRTFSRSISNLKIHITCAKTKRSGRPHVSEERWKVQGRVLFEVYGSLRQLQLMNLEFPTRKCVNFYGKKCQSISLTGPFLPSGGGSFCFVTCFTKEFAWIGIRAMLVCDCFRLWRNVVTEMLSGIQICN